MASQKQEPTGRQLVKGRWTPPEDEKLKEAVALHGATNWASLSSKAGLNRCGKSCRLRWVNYLRPYLKRGELSEQEEDLIIRMHKLLGNRWALIAGRLPGRTDNEIKNYWNTHLSKRVNKKQKKRNKKEKKSSDGANAVLVDEKPSAADDDQKVHVEMKQECLSSEVVTSAAIIKKEVMINPEDYNTNIFDVDDFFNLLNEEPFSWEVQVPQIP